MNLTVNDLDLFKYIRNPRLGKIRFVIQYRPDTALVNGLNVPGTFTGTINNHENIGKTSEELVLKWNEAHADDLVPIIN